MLSRVSRTIAEHDLLSGPGGRRLLIAVSGGPDSMALLASLWELAPRFRLELEVGFVNHGLRAAADAEGDLVEARARALDLPCHRLAVDVPGARREPGAGGIQEVARRLRLAALAERARERNCGGVALGHQADDQTETVLFRIVRGTGLAGLAGIPYRRAPFIRPLLDVTRAQVIDYLQRRSLSFISDPSNRDPRSARARIRHEVLPVLRKENPRVDEALRRLADSAAGRLYSGDPGAADAIPARVAARVAEAQRTGHGTQTFSLSGARKIVVTYGRVEIIKASEKVTDRATGEEDVDRLCVGVAGPGVFPVGPDAGLAVREYRGDSEPPAPEGVVWFDGDRLTWPLSVRRRRAGDRLRPRRGAGTRKLADLMIDAKIPRGVREKLPVVVDSDGHLLFVPGLRPSEIAEPSTLTRRWIGLGWLEDRTLAGTPRAG